MKQIEIEFKNEGKDTRRMKSYNLNRRTDPDPEDISFDRIERWYFAPESNSGAGLRIGKSLKRLRGFPEDVQ